MSKQSDFFLYLIERYAEHKETTADKVFGRMDSPWSGRYDIRYV